MYTLDHVPLAVDRLVRFCAECPSPRLTEVAQIMYPVLVHLCIYLLSQEYRDHGSFQIICLVSTFTWSTVCACMYVHVYVYV